MNTRTRAFTVVDLTVAIAVLTLLVLIATPVIAGSRLTSRLVMDLANLWQHAVMKDNFVAANKGRMPNAPPGRGRLPSGFNTGGPDRPSRFFAAEGFEHNGWVIPSGIAHDDIHRNYHITFGDYLVEGQGVDMLQDVFISTGADPLIDVAANWEDIRANKDGQYPAALENLDVFGRHLLSSDPTSDHSEAWRLNPGYRYTIAGIYGQHEHCADWDFWFPGRCCTCQIPMGAVPWNNPWTFYRFFRGEAEFRLPSGKVMFYAPFADHNDSADVYTQTGAEIPVVMVDGSARISRPVEEMPNPHSLDFVNAMAAGELWATPVEIQWGGRLPVTTVDRSAWFAYTRGGPAGYDFRPGTQTAACRWDYSEDDNVNSSDLATLLAGDGRPVRSNDLAQLLSSWGLCGD